MLFKPKLNFHKKRRAAFIYNVVFNSGFSVFVVFILFASFLVQPVHKAYAVEEVEEEVVDETSVAESVNFQQAEQTQDDVLETADVLSIPAEILENEPGDSSAIQNPSTEEDESLNSEVNTSSQNDDDVMENEDDEEIDASEGETNSADQVASTTGTSSSQNNSSSTSSLANADIEDDNLETETGTSSSGSDDNPTDDESQSSNATTSDQELDTEISDNVSSSTGNSSDSIEDDETSDIVDGSDNYNSTTTNEVSEEDQTTFVEVQNLNTEDNFYQFNRQSCVAIGDGTYHCTVNAQSGIDSNAVVYSSLGKNSNMEIFLKTSKGDVKQLTDNGYDDTSPNYDAETLQVVWQRLVDDRYQIILYDIEEDEEKQLTFSRTNNMEPKVSEAGIVWQAWDGHDWEVMYFDGKYTDQLTDNLTQDVAPAIDDGYILWSVLGNSEQEAKVYSIASGEVLNINGYEGGVIANPRFVLVYDTMFDNGDVITQGFDPTTGLSAPIAAKPAEDPIDIPDTDSTGETRALIQNKSSQKDEYDPENLNNNTGTSTPNGASGTSTTTDSVPETLDLKQTTDNASSTELVSTTTNSISDTEFELTDYDLILTPVDDSVATETATSTSS